MAMLALIIMIVIAGIPGAIRDWEWKQYLKRRNQLIKEMESRNPRE